MDLVKLLKEKKRTLDIWVKYETFDVCLEYIDRHEMTQMLENSKRRTWKKHQQTEELDEKLFNIQLAEKIKNWKGLTLGKLARLTNIEISSVEQEQEVVCNEQNKLALMNEIYGFDRFVMDTASEIQRFRDVKLEKEIKNSETSQG